MTQKPDNPPAFPVLIENWRGEVRAEMKGMTLRDYFAASATEYDVDYYRYKRVRRCVDGSVSFTTDEQVMTREQAKFAHADAMLKAREATND